MTQFFLYDPDTGDVKQALQASEQEAASLLAQQLDLAWAPGGASWDTHYVDESGTARPYTEAQTMLRRSRRGVGWTWQPRLGSWRDDRTMATIVAAKVDELQAARDAALSVFTWDGNQFDADTSAKVNLLGLARAAEDPSFTTEHWRLADNSWRALSAADALSVYQALTTHIKTCFQTFGTLEAQALAANDPSDLDNIQWPT